MLFSSCNFFSRFDEHLLPQVTTTIDKVQDMLLYCLLHKTRGVGGGNKHIFVIQKNVCCTAFHITEACSPTCAKTACRVKQIRSNSFWSQFHCASLQRLMTTMHIDVFSSILNSAPWDTATLFNNSIWHNTLSAPSLDALLHGSYVMTREYTVIRPARRAVHLQSLRSTGPPWWRRQSAILVFL